MPQATSRHSVTVMPLLRELMSRVGGAGASRIAQAHPAGGPPSSVWTQACSTDLLVSAQEATCLEAGSKAEEPRPAPRPPPRAEGPR